MSLLVDALNCRNHARPPIWLMRQAGRYLPEYQKLRAGRQLLEMFHDVETIVEVTMQPVDILGVDGAILFSDILTVLDGLAIRYDFHEGKGPVVEDPPKAMQSLPVEEAYLHITASIQQLKKGLRVPLLGFAGAPYTVAHYLYHGKAKERLFKAPDLFEQTIEQLTQATIAYAKCQEAAGVDAIQLFDSWANQLPLEEFRKYSLEPMRRIADTCSVPVILFCRGSCFFAKELAAIKPAAISLDWSGEIAQVRQEIGTTIALQGNLDPMVLYGSQDEIKRRVDPILEAMREDPGFIFNLGHGLLPDIPVENVKFLVDYVKTATFAEAQ